MEDQPAGHGSHVPVRGEATRSCALSTKADASLSSNQIPGMNARRALGAMRRRFGTGTPEPRCRLSRSRRTSGADPSGEAEFGSRPSWYASPRVRDRSETRARLLRTASDLDQALE